MSAMVASSFGVVPTDADGKVTAFIEKPPRDEAPTNFINAGIYVLEPSVLGRIAPDVRVSIERETFPACLEDGPTPNRMAGSSIYPAVQNMVLATRALGLGTTLTFYIPHALGAEKADAGEALAQSVPEGLEVLLLFEHVRRGAAMGEQEGAEAEQDRATAQPAPQVAGGAVEGLLIRSEDCLLKQAVLGIQVALIPLEGEDLVVAQQELHAASRRGRFPHERRGHHGGQRSRRRGGVRRQDRF